MGKKRKHRDRNNSERLLRRIEKLEDKLRKRRRRSSSSSSLRSLSRSHSPSADRTRISLNKDDEKHYLDPFEHDECIADIPASPVDLIAISDPPLQEPSTSAASSAAKSGPDDENTIVHLDDEILTILGDAPKEESPVGKNIHKDIATRLHDVLLNGLKKESKDKILEEYHIPGNCQLFKAPILNPEVKATASDLLQKKDASLAARQGQIGVALTALTCAMDILTSDKSDTSQILLKHISNASRLMCDSHCIDTKMRRNFLISTMNNKFKETLKESKRDQFLFGEGLNEKLKAAKAITKTSQDLRFYKPNSAVARTSAPSSATSNLNWKHPQPNAPNMHRKPPAAPPPAHHRTAGATTSRRGETARRTMSSRVNKNNAYYKRAKRS